MTSDSITDAARVAARDADEAWQLDRLVAWMSDVEPADWPLPVRQKKDTGAHRAGVSAGAIRALPARETYVQNPPA